MGPRLSNRFRQLAEAGQARLYADRGRRPRSIFGLKVLPGTIAQSQNIAAW